MGPGSGNTEGPGSPDPRLWRRLLRAQDRMDVASHEEWPVGRLAQVTSLPLLETVADAAQRVLPRKIRLLLTVLKTWRRSRRAR